MRIQVQLKRILDILFLINDSRYGWEPIELARRYGVHKRTIVRDLQTLSQMMLAAEVDGKWFGLNNKTAAKIKEQACASSTTQ